MPAQPPVARPDIGGLRQEVQPPGLRDLGPALLPAHQQIVPTTAELRLRPRQRRRPPGSGPRRRGPPRRAPHPRLTCLPLQEIPNNRRRVSFHIAEANINGRARADTGFASRTRGADDSGPRRVDWTPGVALPSRNLLVREPVMTPGRLLAPDGVDRTCGAGVMSTLGRESVRIAKLGARIRAHEETSVSESTRAAGPTKVNLRRVSATVQSSTNRRSTGRWSASPTPCGPPAAPCATPDRTTASGRTRGRLPSASSSPAAPAPRASRRPRSRSPSAGRAAGAARSS